MTQKLTGRKQRGLKVRKKGKVLASRFARNAEAKRLVLSWEEEKEKALRDGSARNADGKEKKLEN